MSLLRAAVGYEDSVGGRADLRPAFYRGWRLKWRADGMRWWSPEPPPYGWDPQAQFAAISSAAAGAALRAGR